MPVLISRGRPGGGTPLTPVVPDAPSIAGTPGNTVVHLSWNAPEDNGDPIVEYRVYRNNTLISPNGLLATSFDDTGQPNGVAAAYYVTAVNGRGESVGSNSVSIAPVPDRPDPPVLSGTGGQGRVDMSWIPGASNGGGAITSFKIWRQGNFLPIATVGGNTTAFSDTTMSTGSPISYWITAVNAGGESDPSNAITVTPTTPANVPSAPVLSAPVVSSGQVSLSWPTPSDGGNAIQDYHVIRNNTLVAAFLGPVNGWVDTTVAASTQYTYQVTALNGIGESNPSNSRTITTLPTSSGAPADVVNSDGAWKMIAWGNSFMVNVDPTLWAGRGFAGYIYGVNFPNYDGSGNVFTTSPAPAASKYNLQRNLEANFDPGAAGCEGYIKSHIRNPGRNGLDSPLDWFDTAQRTAFVNWWGGVATWMQSRGHGMVGISHDTEQGYWGLNYPSNMTNGFGGGTRIHTDAATIAQIESWGYAVGQAVFTAMPNCILITYDCEAPGGYADAVVYTQNKTLDDRAYVFTDDAHPNTYWYQHDPRGPKLQYYIGFLKAMADFGGPGARFVMGQDFYYKPAGNQAGKYFYETQGGIAGWSQKFTAAQWAKLYNKIDITFMTWATDDNLTPGKSVAMTGENGSSNHGGAGWTGQQVDARRLGMGPRRIEYIYEGEPSRACYYDQYHNAIEQPPGVAQGGGFFFQENNWYLRNPGDLPRYNFSDYGMDFPAFGNPPGGHLPGMIAGKNRSVPLDTTRPTLANASGVANTVTKTNLGGGVYRLAGRVAHPNGCRGAVAWNISTDPNRNSPKANPLIWQQAGGSVSAGFPNAYQEFGIDVPGSPGQSVVVQGISSGDQTRNITITL